jgi:hypothetical protein
MKLSKYLKRLFFRKHIFNYRGCLIELCSDGWLFREKKYDTLDQIDKIIDDDLTALSNSIISKK